MKKQIPPNRFSISDPIIVIIGPPYYLFCCSSEIVIFLEPCHGAVDALLQHSVGLESGGFG